MRPANSPRGFTRAPARRGNAAARASTERRRSPCASTHARPRAPSRSAAAGSLRSATRASANSSSVRAVRAGGGAPSAATRATSSSDATTAAPASNASKTLFGVPVPSATGATAIRAARRNAGMSGTGLTTSTPPFPARDRSQLGRVGPAEDEARLGDLAPDARPDVVDESLHGEDVRTVQETTGEGHDGAARAGFERRDRDAVRNRARAGRKPRRVERRRREKDRRALGRAGLRAKKARSLGLPVRATPGRRVVVRGLPRRRRERVHVVDDARQRRQRADVGEEAREEDADEEVRIPGRFAQGKAERSCEECGLQGLAGCGGAHEGGRKPRTLEAHGMHGRRILHSKNLFSSGGSPHDRRLVARASERREVQLRAQAVARVTRARQARDDEDGLHAGGLARCQREGAATPRKTARVHIRSESERSAGETGGTSGG